MEWRPPESASDISRLNKLVAYYESVNLDQIQQIANLKQTQEANAKSLLEYEKNKKLLTKTIKSLEGRMKFDKIAADGTKKKFNLLEYEVREIKHSNEQMSNERNDDKAVIAQLREDLNSNRSDKLKFMHENAVLKKQSATLTVNETSASADAVFARSNLLDKLEMLDSVMAQNETLRRTVSAQSEEMLTLSHEQHDLNEKLFAANKQVVNLELMTAEHNRTIDILQHEISRLRKELASSSHSFNVKSTALLTRGGGSNPANRVSTDITHSSYGNDEDGPYSLARRPHTQQGLSRERNQLASTASSSASRSQQRRSLGDSTQFQIETASHSTTELPHLSDFDRSSYSQSRGGKREYQYVDLSSHLQRPASSSSSAVLVAGGSIGTNGNSIGKTVRTHLLQDYSDVIVAAHVGPSLRTAGVTEPSSVDLKTTARGSSAMCSPVSTPFRRPPSQASPLKSLPLGQTNQDLTSWFEERPRTKGSTASMPAGASLSHIKKCYSVSAAGKKPTGDDKISQVARASTAAGRQEGAQSHERVVAAGERSSRPVCSKEDAEANSFSPTSKSNFEQPTDLELGGPGLSCVSPARVSFQPARPGSGVETPGAEDAAVMTIKNRRNKPPPPETNNKKSMFVGAGLGLKHNQELDAELRNLNKGSTHQILKKILGDRFD